MIDEELFVDKMNPRLYELYQSWCQNNGVSADLKGYLLWLDEVYL